MARKAATLPPGVEKRKGRLVRVIPKQAADGSTREQLRPIAPTLQEARATRSDFHHPQLGWIREGRKVERVRDASVTIADATASVAVLPEEPGVGQSPEPNGSEGEGEAGSDSNGSEE